MDETWAHHFDPETKLQSMQWKQPTSPPIVNFLKTASARKIMASVFWDSEGVLMIDYLERGKTVTGVYYAELIRNFAKKLRKSVGKSCPRECCFTATMRQHTPPTLPWRQSMNAASNYCATHHILLIWHHLIFTSFDF